jgi:Gram-negative bacterial TonB protein C-terminal
MSFLQHMYSAALALCLLEQADVSVQVRRVEPPAHPVNTLATGLVVVEVDIERITGKIQTQTLYGEPPFLASALEALEQWRFVIPPKTDIGTTSVTFLFRSPAIYSVKIGTAAVRPWNFEEDFPALPQEIIDPGYPPTSVATGAAILEVRVSASGFVTSTRPVEGVAPLIDQAQKAVKNWRFSPARNLDKAVASTVFVVISFVLPT